jgi:RNA polymerase sigma-70 factor (ECF subfamily)
MEPETFRALLERVRAGDAEAAAELVRHFEPAIRRRIRMEMTSPHLRRLLDTVDICQSVLAAFFVRASAGQFDLTQPAQLHKLLAEMAHNKLLNHARSQQTQRRDHRRLEPGGAEDLLQAVADPGASPSHIVAGRELLQRARHLLSAEELELMDQRTLGRSWAEIAAEKGVPEPSLRKRYTRALDRVAQALGL